jgi:hypothetical protein
MDERAFGLYPRHLAGAHTPDFLWSFVGSLNFMRLSLMKGHTRTCPELRIGNSGHLARFWRDMGNRRPSPQACRGAQNSTRVPQGFRARFRPTALFYPTRLQ